MNSSTNVGVRANTDDVVKGVGGQSMKECKDAMALSAD